jgi:uncharacterized protein DUF4105
LTGILQKYWLWVNKNLSLLYIILLFTPPAVKSEVQIAPVEAVIERATDMRLADQLPWLNLLHYKSPLLGERASQVDDADFFLAENGAHNAQAELEADLRGFFSTQASAHPRCIFPARFHWLDRQLNLLELLPDIECTQFNRWKDKFDAQTVTLLFPGMHLENPASMFGHTFIRFDRADNNHLLSYTLSYAASYDESDHVLVYSWKGITGGYPGKFYLEAYFETLQEYSDIEQRDIWEYKLNLTQEEIGQLIRHLWEVQGVYFDYFFFRENCSYRLLALLDVAREDINMSIDTHPLYAIPVDTVRDIEKAGLIVERNYRPSTHNKIEQMTEQVGEDAAQAAIKMTHSSGMENKQLIKKIAQPFPLKQQAKILQLADEILSQNKKLSADEADLQLEILSARSDLPVTQQDIEFNYRAIAPEQSHASARWQMSAGEREQQRFYEIGLRPAFHDLLDVSKGFINGASISVLETKLRWYQQQETLKLQSLNFFSLESITPVKPWATPLSRKISFKIKQRDINSIEQITEFDTRFSAGYAAQVKSVLMYTLLKGQLEYATELKNNHGFYLGADLGALWNFDYAAFSGQIEMSYQLLQQISGELGDLRKFNFGFQINVLNNHALRVEYEMIDYDSFKVEQAKLSYLLYF